MPPQAYALVTLFTICSVIVGVLAVWLVRRTGGPRRRVAYVPPIIAAFGAFYLIGHRLGISVGPEIGLFGFQVALLGDLAIGFLAAFGVASLQAAFTRTRQRRSAGAPTSS
jgi:hypothetical protein